MSPKIVLNLNYGLSVGLFSWPRIKLDQQTLDSHGLVQSCKAALDRLLSFVSLEFVIPPTILSEKTYLLVSFETLYPFYYQILSPGLCLHCSVLLVQPSHWLLQDWKQPDKLPVSKWNLIFLTVGSAWRELLSTSQLQTLDVNPCMLPLLILVNCQRTLVWPVCKFGHNDQTSLYLNTYQTVLLNDSDQELKSKDKLDIMSCLINDLNNSN